MVAEYLIIFATLALAGTVKGALGAGLPVVAVPVLASFFGVPFAVAVLVVPIIVTNLWQVWQFRGEAHGGAWLAWLCVFAGIGVVGGTFLLANLPERALSLVLAFSLFAYIGLRLPRPHLRIPPRLIGRVAPPIGLLSGLLIGATGISAPLSITFLASLGLTRSQFVFAVSCLFLTFVAVQAPALVIAGILTWQIFLVSVAALIPIALAMPLGNWLAARMSTRAFDYVILGLLFVVAVKLLIDAVL